MKLHDDLLSDGQYAMLGGTRSYHWGLMYGLGNVEFNITACQGMCLRGSRRYGLLFSDMS